MYDYTKVGRIEWIDLAERFYDDFFKDCERTTLAQWQRRTRYLGWSAADVLAHLASAIPVNFQQALSRALAGDPSAPPEFNTFARNAREVERRRGLPIQTVLEELRVEGKKFLNIYRQMSEEQWTQPAWFYVGRVNVRAIFLALFGDEVFHLRDLALARGDWRGFDAEMVGPLMDWYLRELRPASFRPELANGLEARVVYRLTGPGGGEWTQLIEHGTCRTLPGGSSECDVLIEGQMEELVSASQGRAAPWVGGFARLVDWIRGPSHTEDVVALITGVASLAWAARLKRSIRVSGDSALADRLDHCFWHFWQRTDQTQYNIAQG